MIKLNLDVCENLFLKKIIIVVLICFMLSTMVACGGGGGGGGENTTANNDNQDTNNVSGIWILENHLKEKMVVSLDEADNNITGIATWAMAANINVTGSRNGDSITIMIGEGALYPISAIGNIEGITITGVWIGFDTKGNPVNGTFTGEKYAEKEEQYIGSFAGSWSGLATYFLKNGDTIIDKVRIEIDQASYMVSGLIEYNLGTFSFTGNIFNSLCFLRWAVPCGSETRFAVFVLSESNSTLYFEQASRLFCDEGEDINGIFGYLQYGGDEFDFTGTYDQNVIYRVSSASGTCGLNTGDLPGDDVLVVRNSADNMTISFGIPGHFWTELITSYSEQTDGGGTEYGFSSSGTLLEGGDWANASYTIDGQFEPGSVWAYVSINGENCTAEVDIFAYK